MTRFEVRGELFKLKEENYKIFSEKLIPNHNDKIIGIRLPILKKFAKEISKKIDVFDYLDNEKIYYHEEILLYGFLTSMLKCDTDKMYYYIEKFSRLIDNWANCDSIASAYKIFSDKNKDKSFDFLLKLLENNPTVYQKRFVIVVLFRYYLTSDYITKACDIIFSIIDDDYYVKMAQAWALCEVLTKDYVIGLEIIKTRKLDSFVHNKGIQKARESYRIEKDKKVYLLTLKK